MISYLIIISFCTTLAIGFMFKSAMVFFKKRVILLSNLLPFPVEFQVTLFPTHYVQKVFMVSPRFYKEIGAAEFTDFHDNNPHRPAIISIFVDGSKIDGFCFNSRDLITYEKIEVGQDQEAKGKIVITGVKAPCTHQALLKDYGWLFRGKFDEKREEGAGFLRQRLSERLDFSTKVLTQMEAISSSFSKHFALTDDGQQEIVVDSKENIGVKTNKLLLVGTVLSVKPVNKESLCRTFYTIWKPKARVTIVT
ncbi:hypothetical protein ACE6H2_004707 [Prunus campanulata]